jgi:hypothetical protein
MRIFLLARRKGEESELTGSSGSMFLWIWAQYIAVELRVGASRFAQGYGLV